MDILTALKEAVRFCRKEAPSVRRYFLEKDGEIVTEHCLRTFEFELGGIHCRLEVWISNVPHCGPPYYFLLRFSLNEIAIDEVPVEIEEERLLLKENERPFSRNRVLRALRREGRKEAGAIQDLIKEGLIWESVYLPTWTTWKGRDFDAIDAISAGSILGMILRRLEPKQQDPALSEGEQEVVSRCLQGVREALGTVSMKLYEALNSEEVSKAFKKTMRIEPGDLYLVLSKFCFPMHSGSLPDYLKKRKRQNLKMHPPRYSEDERSVYAVANRLSMQPTTLYRWIEKGIVRMTYEKGEMRIPKEEEEVLALLISLADLGRLVQELPNLPTLVARFKQIPEEELDRKMRLTRKALSNLRLIVKLEPAESRFKKRKHAAWKWVSRMKKKGKSWREIIEVVEEQLKRTEP